MSLINVSARQLVSHLKQLERRIRAEERPSFAELQDVFETARSLDRQLEEAGPVRIACAVSPCPIEGTEEVIRGSGQKHCSFHAQQLRALMGDRPVAKAS